MCLVNLQEQDTACSFPQTLFGRWTPSFRTPVLRSTELTGLGRIFRDHHADKCVLHSESSGLDVKGQVSAQPSARLQCPPGELVFFFAIITMRGAPSDHFWHWRMGAIPCRCLSHHPLSSSVPSPSIRGICLAKLINLFNDAISFFHINLCPENLPLSVLPRRRAFTHGLLYELELAPLCGENDWHSVSSMGPCLGEHQGTVLWLSWILEWLYCFTNVTFWCQLMQCSKSLW